MAGQRPIKITETAIDPYSEHTLTVYAHDYTITSPSSGSDPGEVGRKDFPLKIPVLIPLKDTILEDLLLTFDEPESTDSQALVKVVKAPVGIDPLTSNTGEQALIENVTGDALATNAAFTAFTPKSICVASVAAEGFVKDSHGVPLHNKIKAGEILWLILNPQTYGAFAEPKMLSITHRTTQALNF